ncbi:MAG: septal ring lytic transglycosylase RlpA family protein [Actinobacteria bacterium]|nr:septal ring lytic transglycosylase RlpA family protein [Actinomycetota bacterium]
MSPILVQRQLALAGVALVSALGTLAFSRDAPGEAAESGGDVVPAVTGRWYVAKVGVYGRGFFGRTTPCGVELTRTTRGISHTVLPCGAKIVVSHRGREVPTEVVDRGAYAPGHEFELTAALASDLGVGAPTTVRWRFASEPVE